MAMYKFLTDNLRNEFYMVKATNAKPLVFTNHAIQRYIEYTGCKRKNAIKGIKKYLNNVTEMKLKEEYRLRQLLEYGVENEAVYIRGRYKDKMFLFVIVGNRVKTIHKNESQRWEEKCPKP
jgi:hypothetical protein